jgi:L-glyceraldehyde 3-phosphate reductase
VLSGKYNKGKKQGTRGGDANTTLRASHIAPNVLAAVDKLMPIAKARGQSMVQLALSWVLRRKEVTSALIGIRNLEQLKDNLGALDRLDFTEDELKAIDEATKDGQMDLHPKPQGWLR